MKKDELINKYPEFYNQLVAEAAQSERDRVTALIALSKAPGASMIISEAIKDGRTAEDVAVDMLKVTMDRGAGRV